MNRLNLSSSMIAREELEAAWRQKTQEAQDRYRLATKQYNKLLEESEGVLPASDSPLLLARHAQSAALDEYKQVLRISTEFTVNGQIPQKEPAHNGGRS